MAEISWSPPLQKFLAGFEIERDREGMSPARVFRLTRAGETLFLKTSDERFFGTTYDVEHEKTMMEWLRGKVPVPEVVYYERHEGHKFLVMTAMPGEIFCRYFRRQPDVNRAVDHFAEAIRLLQSVPVEDCPCTTDVATRLRELDNLIRQGLIDDDRDNWEEDTPFTNPHDLYTHLVTNQPEERLVLSHGDFCDSNLFVVDDRVAGFIDLGRCGKADLWYDIAFCVREIRGMSDDPKHLDLLFRRIGREPDWEKIRYYILLDELF